MIPTIRRRTATIAAAALSVATACTPFPDPAPPAVHSALGPSQATAPPRLLPLSDLVAPTTAGTGDIQSDPEGAALTARAARLRARAAGMRGPAVDPETRARLDAATAGT